MSFIFFPFYNSARHHFLIKKWWFRALIVIYIAIFIPSTFSIWRGYAEKEYQKCLDAIIWPSFSDEFHAQNTEDIEGLFKAMREDSVQQQAQSERQTCDDNAYANWFDGKVFALGVLVPLMTHYAIQLLFFLVVVDFIILGSREQGVSASR